MPERYWLVHPNGGRQLIDPRSFDIARLTERVGHLGGRIVVEVDGPDSATVPDVPAGGLAISPPSTPPAFEPPVAALGGLFRARLERVFDCEQPFDIDMNTRPTVRVLGGYYRRRRLVRVYTHDRATGRRPLEELFDTFLHEVAHHIEYTEPHTFHAPACGRVPGRMHSRLFWRILGELKRRWAEQARQTG